jgi:hypothetical protein
MVLFIVQCVQCRTSLTFHANAWFSLLLDDDTRFPSIWRPAFFSLSIPRQNRFLPSICTASMHAFPYKQWQCIVLPSKPWQCIPQPNMLWQGLLLPISARQWMPTNLNLIRWWQCSLLPNISWQCTDPFPLSCDGPPPPLPVTRFTWSG